MTNRVSLNPGILFENIKEIIKLSEMTWNVRDKKRFAEQICRKSIIVHRHAEHYQK